jgi:scyllo-inositol 2-dehydrogenase (NADP+)
LALLFCLPLILCAGCFYLLSCSCMLFFMIPMDTSNVLNVGLASYGMSGQIFHAPFITTTEGFRLSTVLERSSEKARAHYPKVKIVRSFEDLLQDDELDLVVVNTPNALHYEMALKALEAGKHVVVEKPFTGTAAEAYALDALAKEKGKLLSVYHNRRWDGDFMTVRKLLDQQLLGTLVEYEAHFDRFRNFIKPQSWKEEPGAATGLLYDLGSHMVDQALVLFGKPKAVWADISTLRPQGKIDDYYCIHLEYERLKVTLKSSYLVREQGPRYTLHGTEGSFLKWGTDLQEAALNRGGKPGTLGWGEEAQELWGKLNTQLNDLHFQGKIKTLPGNYGAYYQNIYRAIKGMEPLEVTAVQAAQVIEVLEAAWQSHASGCKVTLA